MNKMFCFSCKNKVENRTPMMNFELNLTGRPRCRNCTDKLFAGIWCDKCELFTSASERPLILKDNIPLFACKKCKLIENGDTVVVTMICKECDEHVAYSMTEQVYGPKKCTNDDEHLC